MRYPAASARGRGPGRGDEPALEFKPRLQELLRALRLDCVYERGAGDHLYYRDAAGREVEVLDLVGGYGALLLGHAHPALVAEAQRLLACGRPMHAQGSRREFAGRLARELSERAGGDCAVVFGNSGAEAVEAAMKHALLETGGRTFIALERAFHGKTLGAVQLTASAEYREAFAVAGLSVVRVALNHLEQLEAAFARTKDLAGCIFEPILGEGGVRLVEPAFARRALELCRARGVPLIADECQTGCGRTGTFLACEQLGIRPDYVVLSKALGGGLAKISALLIRRERYRDEFDLKHTSTYAEDDFSCAVALKALELIDEPLLAACREKGARLRQGLVELAGRYPGVIREVRGRGLMLAVELRQRAASPSFVLRFLNAQEDLGYLVTGYLLAAHQIRVAPTLSDRFTLRLEPSVGLDEAALRRFLGAMEDVCALLRADDAVRLTRFLAEGEPGEPAAGSGGNLARSDGKFFAYDEPGFRIRQRQLPSSRVAWLCHLIDADDLVSLEPPFGRTTVQEREELLARFVSRAAPVVMSSVDVRSAAGGVVRFYPLLLPFTSSWAKRRIDQRRLGLPQRLVEQGLDLAGALGCRMVSLGQYTSIVTRNGTRVAQRGIGVTSGNSYAVALAFQAIERAQRESGVTARDSVLVVAGAAGNIGRACAEVLGPRYRRVMLVGSAKPGSMRRLQALAAGMPNAIATTRLEAVGDGRVVVAALNAVDAPLLPRYFADNAIVCDLSVPSALPPEAAAQRPDLMLIKGGVAALPGREDLGIPGFPLARGQVYGCMAEAMLLGLEGATDALFTGPLSAGHIVRIAAMAARHGFQLADYKRGCVLGSEPQLKVYANSH